MFALILIVIIGLGIALFSQQNTQSVPLTVGPYVFSAVPTYLVVVLSMLFGLFIGWILSVMDFFSHSLTMRKKESALHTAERRATTLEDRIASLKEENARLKGEKHGIASVESDRVHEEDVRHEHRGNFITRVRERLTPDDRKEAI
jgi:uncharacterized integral membrane protein